MTRTIKFEFIGQIQGLNNRCAAAHPILVRVVRGQGGFDLSLLSRNLFLPATLTTTVDFCPISQNHNQPWKFPNQLQSRKFVLENGHL